MRNILFVICLLICTSAIAAERVTLQTGSGSELGTIDNPIRVNCISGCGDPTGGMATTDIDTSAELRGVVTDENGTGALLFSGAISPVFTTPNIGVATGSVSGNAGTATALAANGANCSASQIPLGVDASGAVEGCYTLTTISGNAGTATALAANGSNCSAGQAALGVDASGSAEGCWTPSSTGLPTAMIGVDGTTYALTNAGIESALAALPAGGGRIIISGAVTLTGDIDIDRSNVYMQCIGKNTTITLANATNTHMVSLNGYDNVTIDGCTFDGNKANQTTGGTVIQVDTGVTDFTFKNNTVHDSYNNGVYANTTSRIKVVDNYFYDIGKTGVSPHSGGFAVEVYGTSTDIEVSRNTITNALGDGSIFIYGTDTSNRNKYVVLKDNHISGIDDGDEKCCIQNVFSDYMTMSGNICHDNINDGTSPDNGNNGLCSFNSDNVTVSNNVVYNVDGTGIEVYGTDMVVSGNTIDLCGFEQGYAGIYMGGTVGSVTGNKINNCNVGVQLEGTDHVVASGNFINNDTATTNQATKVIANAGQTVTDTMMVDNSIYAGTSSMDPAQIVLELSTGTLTGVILRNRVNGAYADAFSSYSDATIANSDIVLDDGLNNGWTIKSAANTACSTTCVYGCNYGYDSGTNLPVACSNATADACYCKNGE